MAISNGFRPDGITIIGLRTPRQGRQIGNCPSPRTETKLHLGGDTYEMSEPIVIPVRQPNPDGSPLPAPFLPEPEGNPNELPPPPVLEVTIAAGRQQATPHTNQSRWSRGTPR